MEPVTGHNVTIQFLKGDDYYDYGCATDVSIDFKLETKPVRTYSQGTWNKPRGQRHSYGISLAGLIVFDDDAIPGAFDLLEYLIAMTAVQYRIFFDESISGKLRLREGIALPVSVNLSGGAEGFGQGNIELEGDGEPDIRNAIINCAASVLTIAVNEDQTAILITGHTGDPVRYDYGIDGGGLTTAFIFTDPAELDLPDDIAVGDHDIQIFPVCENGEYGTEFNGPFTIEPPPPPDPDPEVCAAPTALVISSITETTAEASWTGATPFGDGYYFEVLQGATVISTGTIPFTNQSLTGLTSGTLYTFRVKHLCEEGVSESTFITEDFETVSEETTATYDYEFTEDAGAGQLLIRYAPAGAILTNVSVTGSGSEIIDPIADIYVRVTCGISGSIRYLNVTDVTLGSTIYNNSGAFTQDVTFTPIAGHLYNIIATTSL